MKLGLGMLAGSAVSAFGISAFLGDNAKPDVRLAIWLGMLGPLVATLWSMFSAQRVYRRQPADLTRVMIIGFIAKMVFFGGYVALIVKAGWVGPVPFTVSFVSYFLALHFAEALYLRRLFATP